MDTACVKQVYLNISHVLGPSFRCFQAPKPDELAQSHQAAQQKASDARRANLEE
jgi:hypothetical protein